MDTMLEKTDALRSEAWAALVASPDFNAFKVMDDAVVALGGESIMPTGLSAARSMNGSSATATADRVGRVRTDAVRRLAAHKRKRISHGDAAFAALKEKNEPLPIGRFMEAAIEKGAVLGGDDPLSNFRSAVSKDKRFRSIQRNNMYFWWFTGSPLPQNWKEATDPDLLDQSVASSSSSKEGGDADATTTI